MDKIVKRVSFAIFFFISLCLCAQSKYKKDYVQVIITEQWNSDSLSIVQKKLKTKYNIDVDFKKIKIDKNKKIVSLDMLVNTNDGYKGSASFEGKIDGFRFGFFRDYSFFTLTNFSVGYLKN